MLYILAIIIILYTASHFLFKKNEIYIRLRKWIDIVTITVTTILVFAWVEIFKLSFLIFIYFIISIGVISYLVHRLRIIESKKIKAEEIIGELKNEEKVLENEIETLQKDNIKK